MNLKDNIINLLRKLGQGNAFKKRLPPESLPPETMAKVMQEVKFLRKEHAVDVRNLEAGEKPTEPRRADLEE